MRNNYLIIDLAQTSETGLLFFVDEKIYFESLIFSKKPYDEVEARNNAYSLFVSKLNKMKIDKECQVIIETIDWSSIEWLNLQTILENVLIDVFSIKRENIKRVNESSWRKLCANDLGINLYNFDKTVYQYEKFESFYKITPKINGYDLFPQSYFTKGFRQSKLIPVLFFHKHSEIKYDSISEDYIDCWCIWYFRDILKSREINNKERRFNISSEKKLSVENRAKAKTEKAISELMGFHKYFEIKQTGFNYLIEPKENAIVDDKDGERLSVNAQKCFNKTLGKLIKNNEK